MKIIIEIDDDNNKELAKLNSVKEAETICTIIHNEYLVNTLYRGGKIDVPHLPIKVEVMIFRVLDPITPLVEHGSAKKEVCHYCAKEMNGDGFCEASPDGYHRA